MRRHVEHRHEPVSEQRLAIGCGSTPPPARRPGRRVGLERGLHGVGDEPGGLRVDNDVPAEQNAADDPPGMRGRVVRGDGGGLGHTRTVEERVLVRLPDTPDLQRLLRRSPGGARPVQGSAGDRVVNRSILNSRAGKVLPTDSAVGISAVSLNGVGQHRPAAGAARHPAGHAPCGCRSGSECVLTLDLAEGAARISWTRQAVSGRRGKLRALR